MKLNIQPIAGGDQLLVSDAENGEMYGVIEATVTDDCKFTHKELLDAVYQKIGPGGVKL